MSIVTAVILSVGVSESGPSLKLVDEWLRSEEQFAYGPLERVEQHAGGTKHPQTYIAIGGYNYFREDEFAAYVMSLPWPSGMHLMMRSENGLVRSWTVQSRWL